MEKAPSNLNAESKASVVTKAFVRAADLLAIRNNILSKVIGVSDATMSRMRKGAAFVAPGEKSYELALLFVRLFRSLDAIVGGDEAVARSWMRNHNTVLNMTPVEAIQSVSGLIDVVNYLDERRAIM